MQTPLGIRCGSLEVQIEKDKVNGTMNLLKHCVPFEGKIDENGNCTIQGNLITLMNIIPYTACGKINELFSGTIKDNLRWGNENATDEEIEYACTLACADEFIKTFPDKYDTHIEQGGTNVSGGQK